MPRSGFVLAVLILFALAPTASASEFGVIFGGSKRVIGDDQPAPGTTLLSDDFSFSNSSIDLYYAIPVEPGTLFKLRVGRIETAVGIREEIQRGGESIVVRRDAEGEVEHAAGVIEYRFSEPFGSTGLFGGVGLYRHQAPGFSASTDYGFLAGVSADFPMSRRYGLILDATYHWTHHDFRPKYLTIGAGLRFSTH